jgi:hypothetical protein
MAKIQSETDLSHSHLPNSFRQSASLPERKSSAVIAKSSQACRERERSGNKKSPAEAGLFDL